MPLASPDRFTVMPQPNRRLRRIGDRQAQVPQLLPGVDVLGGDALLLHPVLAQERPDPDEVVGDGEPLAVEDAEVLGLRGGLAVLGRQRLDDVGHVLQVAQRVELRDEPRVGHERQVTRHAALHLGVDLGHHVTGVGLDQTVLDLRPGGVGELLDRAVERLVRRLRVQLLRQHPHRGALQRRRGVEQLLRNLRLHLGGRRRSCPRTRPDRPRRAPPPPSPESRAGTTTGCPPWPFASFVSLTAARRVLGEHRVLRAFSCVSMSATAGTSPASINAFTSAWSCRSRSRSRSWWGCHGGVGPALPPSTVGKPAHASFVFAKSGFWFNCRVYSHEPIRCVAALPSANSVDTPGPARHGLEHGRSPRNFRASPDKFA